MKAILAPYAEDVDAWHSDAIAIRQGASSMSKRDLDAKRELITHGAVTTDAEVLAQFEQSWQDAAKRWLEESV